MTNDQFEELMALWEEGFGMSEIVGITDIPMALVARFAELWYASTSPYFPTLEQVLEA